MSSAVNRQIIEGLKAQLRELETAGRPARAAAAGTDTAFDHLLPAGGLPGGVLVEWLSADAGAGAATLAFAVGARLIRSGGAVIVLDPTEELFPPALEGLGIPLDRLVILRPAAAAQAAWAFEQALRSRGVALVVGELTPLNDRMFRRLQLAAEQGGGRGFLLRSADCRATPTWAELRLLVRPGPAPTPQAERRRLRVEVLHCRGGADGKAIELELDHETGALSLVTALAAPTVETTGEDRRRSSRRA